MEVADDLPSVPDDAPPAILFRLSYRAREDHRSGYRPGDDRERIVASMRGWWELGPDEVFTVTTRPTLEHLRDARNRWAHFDEIDAVQASQDAREMQMLLTDLGAADEARQMAQIQRTLDVMARSDLT